MIKLDINERVHYCGFLEWMTKYVGKSGIDWDYVIEDGGTLNLGLVVGVQVFDPKKELLVSMRWS